METRDFKPKVVQALEDRQLDSISIVWHVEDVHYKDVDLYPEEIRLSSQQYREILQSIKHNHDANFGVTWETIESAIEAYREEYGV